MTSGQRQRLAPYCAHSANTHGAWHRLADHLAGVSKCARELLLWLVRSPMRNYVHDPRRIEGWIVATGFKKRYENQTAIWLTQVYVRE